MIEVLRDWRDVGSATKRIRRQNLPGHGLPEKNWDLCQLHRLVEPLARNAPIVDLGCGGLHGLRFLVALGFTRLTGIDLSITLRDRAVQARRLLRNGRLPFRLRRGDILRTPFADGSAEVLVALSVVEHGVDPDRFFAEAVRLLRPGGALFVSTDYWPETVETGPDLFGMPWTILDRAGLDAFVQAGLRAGLRLEREDRLPEVGDRVVVWGGREYTFVSIVFRAPIPAGGQ
ncbi:MAG: class I SAM-dependent methyltransferase [Gemmobacter sp.]